MPPNLSAYTLRRVEIIANNSVEADLKEELQKKEITHYTRIGPVHGVGKSGPRMGNTVWPEENFILLIYSTEEELTLVGEAVSAVKARFPEEGVKMFVGR